MFQAKVGMLDNLLDIEVAYSLLKSGEGDLAKDPLDVNYAKLQTDLEVSQILLLQSAMFKRLCFIETWLCCESRQ